MQAYWGPSFIGGVQMIKKIQRRAKAKCILELVDLEYDDRQMALNLPSLSYLRHCADMLVVALQYLTQKCWFAASNVFHQQLSCMAKAGRHNLKLFKPHAQKTVHA